MVELVAIFDILGTVGFLIAFFFALANYKKTKNLSSYWLVFSIATFIGFVWAGSVSLEWLGFYTEIIDEAQQALIASVVTAFAVVTATSIIQPFE